MPALPLPVPGGIAHLTAGASSPGSLGQHGVGSWIPGSLLFCFPEGSCHPSRRLCPCPLRASHIPVPWVIPPGIPAGPSTAPQQGPGLCCARGKRRGLCSVEAVHECTGGRRCFLPETGESQKGSTSRASHTINTPHTQEPEAIIACRKPG